MRAISWAGAAVASLLFSFSLVAIAHHGFWTPVSDDGDQCEFEIGDGEPLARVAANLEREGLIADADLFVFVSRLGGFDRRIRAGWYSIPSRCAPGTVLEMLMDGPNVFDKVTVPEGLWLAETAEILAGTLGLDQSEIERLARDPAFIAELGVPGPTLEGYLFPETYHFPRGVSEEAVLRRMVTLFEEVFGEEERARAKQLGLTPREVITLASIIEAEAVLDEERTRISAVFHNRLRLGWRLQADPTVQYARGTRKRLLTRHLDLDSPYNTYVVGGLPPGPICSPGGLSIVAALEPLENSEDLYFVAAREGGRHIFSRNSRDHERARAGVKRKRKSP